MQLRGLRRLRQQSGLSISQLAELTEVRREIITRLEHGQEEAQPYMVRRLAAALRTDAATLCSAASAPSSAPSAA